MSNDTHSAGSAERGAQSGLIPHSALRTPRSTDPAQRGAAPLSSEAKRRVRFAEHQRKGFESAWNEYFDCYASTTYVDEPIIRLEDISYHLYLKKHINPTNPQWELPSFRQLKKILNLSQDKLQGIESRLAAARLLVKDSGKGKGARGENVANDYLLYEPLELADFLLAVSRGDLPGTLNEKGQRRLAEIRARFCEVGSGKSEVGIGQAEVPATADRRTLTVATLPTSPAPLSGTGGVAAVGTPGAPVAGTPTVPPFGAAPTPDSGTQNTRRPTPTPQQTTQQQRPRPATAPAATAAVASVVVAHQDESLPQGALAIPNAANSQRPTSSNSSIVNRQSSIPDPLVARGITPRIAQQLRRAHPEERIARQLAVYDALRAADPADPRLTPGRLRRQIEEDWAAPLGFDNSPAAPVAAPDAASAEAAERADAAQRQREGAAAARAARLAALGLDEADQATWARVVQAAPVLPPLFRSALFHAPQGDDPAVVIFATQADCDRALAPAHAATRARIAARLAGESGGASAPGRPRPAIAVRYLPYDALLALVSGDD